MGSTSDVKVVGAMNLCGSKRKANNIQVNGFQKRFQLDTETDFEDFSKNLQNCYDSSEGEETENSSEYSSNEHKSDPLMFKIEEIPDAEIISIPLGIEKTPLEGTKLLMENEHGKVYEVNKDEEMPSDESLNVGHGIEIKMDTPQTSTEEQTLTLFDNILDPPELSIFENSLKSNIVLAVLKQDIEIYGTVVVTLLSGRITINGYKARSMEPLKIYSPKGFNWVVISPSSNKKPPKDKVNWQDLNKNFSRAQLNNIQSSYNPNCDAIVLMQRNTGAQNMLTTFAQHMAENVFPVVNVTNRPHYASEYLLSCLIQSADKRRALQVPTVWTKLALQPSSRLIVAGGKGVGKSTLLRYLINRHLKRFSQLLLIDLDIGQPELFVPQTVSCCVIDEPLLGPGFFLNKQPEMAYVVGHVNVVMCAEQYARSVRQLLNHCRGIKAYAKLPWLINTMGYNKGFALELMSIIVDCVQPTDVVQIDSARAISNFDEPLDSKSLARIKPIIYTADEFKLSDSFPKYALHQLRSAVPPQDRRSQDRAWMMSAKDVRYSNFLARLSTALRVNAKHLTDCNPVKIDLQNLLIVFPTAEDFTREELIAGVEANLVYLCKSAPSNLPMQCFGIGVVRAIDYEAQKLYLLPAMPLSFLAKVNCLSIGGDLSLPQGFFKHQGAGVTNNVPYVFIIDDSKSSKSIQQFYYRSPGFLGQPAVK